MAKATPVPEPQDKLDPLAHVETILAAEHPTPSGQNIPLVTEQTKKLNEMLDTISDPSQIEDTLKQVEDEMVKIATVGSDPTPVKLPPPRPTQNPRQAAPKAPKDAPVHDYEPRTPGRRGRGRPAPTNAGNPPVSLPTGGVPGGTTALNGEHVAALLKMTHAVGSTVLGPNFQISDESARAIGDAAMPVLEDFGVAVASRAVHLLMLVATVGMIEGPIMLTVVADMRARAEMQRAGLSTMAMGGSAGPDGPYSDPDAIARAISLATGVQVGNAS